MWENMAQSFAFAAFKKAGKFYFLQSSQTKGRDVLASKKPSLVQLPCAKTREFGEAEFSDCLPFSALVCVFAFDTGGLGLWLGAFGRSRLYRCQSAPGPPMPCFVARSFGGQSRSFRPTLLPLETPVLPTAVCKSCKKRSFLR